MAFALKSKAATGQFPAPTAATTAVLAPTFVQEFTDDADVTAGAVGVIGILPAGCVPVLPMVVRNDAVSDGSTGATFTIGILNADGDGLSTEAGDGGGAWNAAVNVKTAAAAQVAVTTAYLSIKPADHDRKIAMLIAGDGATVTPGKVEVTIPYAAV